MKKWTWNKAEIREEISPKVLLLYRAVIELLNENVDVSALKISDITQKAGIGKGTAYDYFESKEEVITSGILYYLNRFLTEIEARLQEYGDFAGQLNYLFDLIDENLHENECLLRVVHLLLGSSQISTYLQQAVRGGNMQTPLDVLDRIIVKAMEAGELKAEYPVSYVVYTVCARLLTYAALADFKAEDRPVYSRSVDIGQMRKMMYQGIMQEFSVKRSAF